MRVSVVRRIDCVDPNNFDFHHRLLVADDDKPDDVLVLDLALTKLAELAPQRARIVELRFFGGLTVDETADMLEISPATVKRGVVRGQSLALARDAAWTTK